VFEDVDVERLCDEGITKRIELYTQKDRERFLESFPIKREE